jgi:hypothetical protein
MITEWVWVGQGDVLALKKLLIRSSFCHHLKVETFSIPDTNGFTGRVLSTPSWVISKHAASLCERNKSSMLQLQKHYEKWLRNSYSHWPSDSSEFKWFCTVSPLPNLWVESNSISSSSLAHQNWNRDSGLWTFWSIPIDRSTSKMQARWLTNLFTNRQKISSHDRDHSPEVDARVHPMIPTTGVARSNPFFRALNARVPS